MVKSDKTPASSHVNGPLPTTNSRVSAALLIQDEGAELTVGPDVGPEVGPMVGPPVGRDVGPDVGLEVGPEVGLFVGYSDGT